MPSRDVSRDRLSAETGTGSETSKWRRLGAVYGTFAPYLRPYWARLLLAYVGLFGAVALTVLAPWPLKLIFDYILLEKPAPPPLAWVFGAFAGERSLLLVALCLGMVTIAFFETLLSYLHRYMLAAIGQGVVNDIRLSAFERLQGLSLSYHQTSRTGDLILRLTSDINAVRELLVTQTQKGARELVTLVATLGVMLWMDWRLTLAALVIAPVLAVVSWYFARRIRASVRRRRRKESDVAALVHETMTSMALVQAFAQERQDKDRLAQEGRRTLEAGLATARLGGAFWRLVKLLSASGTAVVVGYGAARVLSGGLTPGDLIVFVAYARELYRPIDTLSELAVSVTSSLVSGERILDLMQARSTVREHPKAVQARAFAGEIAFEAVTFGYQPDKPVLRNLSFRIPAGSVAALVGSSGAGKSTIASLLLRFHDPWDGRVLVDGQDIRQFTLASLRRQIGVVLQEPILFRRSVRENLSYGNPEAGFDEIVAAAKAAQAHDFICRLPHGYDTILDERAQNLSGGQKQRIALARAILRNAPILILDEPTTALDALTATEVERALRLALGGRTRLVIAHRLSTVMNADRILVIDGGRVVAQGNHEELCADSQVYREMFRLLDAQSPLSPGQDPPGIRAASVRTGEAL